MLNQHKRKNWLFSQTPKGAHASAKIYSLIETARANGIEPYTYMVEVLTKLPSSTTDEGLDRLLPLSLFSSFISSSPIFTSVALERCRGGSWVLFLVLGFGKVHLVYGGNKSYAVGYSCIISDFETYSQSF